MERRRFSAEGFGPRPEGGAPGFRVSGLGFRVSGDLRRQNAVVKVVVVIVRLFFSDNDLGQPLNHAPSNPTRYQHPYRVPMVRYQSLSVLFEGQYDIHRRVHSVIDTQARPIIPVRELVGALHAHEPGVRGSGFGVRGSRFGVRV
jgi:hypothetical protein